MNVNDLELFLQRKITSSLTDYEILLYTKAIQMLNSGGVFVVDTVYDLPSVAQNQGKLYYIKDIEILAWSDGVDWKDIVLKEISFTRQIWSWGSGDVGQIGDGSINDRSSPAQTFLTDWCQLSSFADHSSSIALSGTLWSWGDGGNRRLGDGTTVDKSSPVQEISSSTNWCQVSAGSSHSSAIKTDGTVWSWGRGACGRLGDGTVVDKCSPVREISSSTNWCQVSAGYNHSTSIKLDGTIWSWGENQGGRLGDGTTANKSSPVQEICSSTNWCQVSAGRGHTLSAKSDGTIWGWGDNTCGRLGDGTFTNRTSPVQEFCSATNWCQVSAGNGFHSAAIKTDGTLWLWGAGFFGKRGDATTARSLSPVQEISSSTNWCQSTVGGDHSSALKTDGTLWTWGRNTQGQLGVGTTVCYSSPVQEISSSTQWVSVCIGNDHSAAIKIVV